MIILKVILPLVALTGFMYGVYRLIKHPGGKHSILVDNIIAIGSSLILIVMYPNDKVIYIILILEIVVGGIDYYIYGRKKVQ